MSFPSSADVPPQSLAIHLDLVGGLAGDMFVAAMLDAMPALVAPLFAELAKVQPAGAGVPTLVETRQAGLRAARFGLSVARARPEVIGSHDGSSHRVLVERIRAAGLDAGTEREALALLHLLAEAEAAVHGTAIDDVHFHELADWDSLLDLVAAGFIAARLAGAQWSASPPPLGGGTVRTAHGVLPVPAPATAHLLRGMRCRDDGVGGERVTPTGAAILRHLVPAESFGQPRVAGRLVHVGMGAGTKVLPGLPNVARALVFERARAGAATSVTTIEFDVDDMTGEEIAHAAERLRAVAGVIDVSVGARIGKKARPLSDFRLLVEPAIVDAVAHACFVETSTLGLRIVEAKRHVLRREERAGDAGPGVKIAQRPDGVRTAKAEHDDVQDAASLALRRRERAAAERRALEGNE
jgi:uncharacterized protein (TIGR00299 family) protein